jgi:hypothetical protein
VAAGVPGAELLAEADVLWRRLAAVRLEAPDAPRH